MIDEFTLFKDNIKPTILSNKESLIKNDINIDNFYSMKYKNSILVSTKKIDIVDNDVVKLGKILGYYPKVCELFNQIDFHKNEIIEYINFNGIYFNTSYLYNECVEWCKDKYLDKMLMKYHKVEYRRLYSLYNKDLKRYIIHTDFDSIKTIIK